MNVKRQDFHVRREAREALGLPGSLFSMAGTVATVDLAAFQALAGWLREQGESGAGSAELYAAAVSHELLHLALLEASESGLLDLPFLMSMAQLPAGSLDRLAVRFGQLFPPGNAAGTPLSLPAVLEECLLLRMHNINPAMADLLPLLDDSELQEQAGYGRLIQLLDSAVSGDGTDPLTGTDLAPLRQLLQAQRAQPHSLTGQLAALQSQFASLLGGTLPELAERLLLATDLLREEHAPRFTGAAAPEGPPGEAAQFMLPELSGQVARARDADWMPASVIIAKSCLVWLQQLSDRHGRNITTLDGIPASELRQLADAGFSVLWLIGIWQRSQASRQIKRRRGQPDAEASAYAIDDYVIDPALGGEAALGVLRQRAAEAGLRLASDMVPNHTGLDARWVREHPEWFIQLDQPPFPAYSFGGPDLSSDPAISIRIEDHYWDGSDAAVVFRRTDNLTGEERYIYHGNDGTGLPWNDTAQLDYLQAEVRSRVIDTMVAVAHRFPVIRFDAAMTLVRRHIRRLWYPPRGEGGAIASRSLHGSMPDSEFDRLLGHEFWLEATGRLEREAPGTLLIAEAFWMLEGYFIRHLGMHRVYNSAFMHMLRDGDNTGFRQFLIEALQSDPESLARFVNFMNNPDEESAAGQFGTGDRYFAVCTLLATLPGLPLFGHGQTEGLTEKYGMEFRSARLAEPIRQDVLDRHERQIFPLLRRRLQFAGASGFELFDFAADSGRADGVISFGNSTDAGHVLVAVNNSAEEVRGLIRSSVPRLRPGTSGPTVTSLAGFLAAEGTDGDFLGWRDSSDGLEYLAPVQVLQEHGLELRLHGWQARVLLDFRRLSEADGLPLTALAAELAGSGTRDLTEAAAQLHFRPLRDWLLQLPDTPGRPLPAAGPQPAAGTVARLRDRAARLALLSQDAELANAWQVTHADLRVWLLIQGLAADELPRELLAPGSSDWLTPEVRRHDPQLWLDDRVGSWLQVHGSDSGVWFRQEGYQELAAALALQAGLRAGVQAGRELWLALQAAAGFSGWRWPRLLQAVGARSDA